MDKAWTAAIDGIIMQFIAPQRYTSDIITNIAVMFGIMEPRTHMGHAPPIPVHNMGKRSGQRDGTEYHSYYCRRDRERVFITIVKYRINYFVCVRVRRWWLRHANDVCSSLLKYVKTLLH